YTQDQRFIVNWATACRRSFKDEELRMSMQTDPHAPARFRAVGAPSDLPVYAASFSCQECDAVVRPEAEHVSIWLAVPPRVTRTARACPGRPRSGRARKVWAVRPGASRIALPRVEPRMLFSPGQRWFSSAELELGLGSVLRLAGRQVQIVFTGSGVVRMYALGSAPLLRAEFRPGERIRVSGEDKLVERVERRAGLLHYHCGNDC